MHPQPSPPISPNSTSPSSASTSTTSIKASGEQQHFCPFELTASLYCRNPDGTLIEAFGRYGPGIKQTWESRFKAKVIAGGEGNNNIGGKNSVAEGIKHIKISSDASLVSEVVTVGQVEGGGSGGGGGGMRPCTTHVYEHKVSGEKQIRGVVVFRPATSSATVTEAQEKEQTGFLNWFVQIALMTSRISACDIPAVEDEKAMITAGMITRVFSEHLRNIAKGDLWDDIGMSFFFERILFFVSRGLPIEAVLPAFPCKSSCLDKVSGTDPDKGEELALRSINRFVEMVTKCYAPGVKVFIVSDGHVFSDCSKFFLFFCESSQVKLSLQSAN